jgi:hypothetical protein
MSASDEYRATLCDSWSGLALKSMSGRLDQPLRLRTEGAGVVVSARSSHVAQRLLGRSVAVFAGGLYAQYAASNLGQASNRGAQAEATGAIHRQRNAA